MKKIMLVDDDEKIVYALSLRFKSSGYQVFSASDPVSGLNKIINNKPDVIILDISMPAGGGLLLAERIIKNHDIPKTPLIFITASNNPTFKQQADTLGVEYFFEKPLNTAHLLTAISECLMGKV